MAADERGMDEKIRVSVQKGKNPRKRTGGFGSGSGVGGFSSSCGGGAGGSREVKWGADRELDAARALQDFAELALMESETTNGGAGGEPGKKWGRKGRRSVKRVKSESPASDWRKNSESLSLNLRSASAASTDVVVVQDHLTPTPTPIPIPIPTSTPTPTPTLPTPTPTIEDNNAQRRVAENMIMRMVKAEMEPEVLRPRPLSSTSVSFGGGRSRTQLTEAQKEERRIRRILANRESARQTIRRRQAMCEELMRRAADLEMENENMKKEKESALIEYQLLKDRNDELKAKMAKVVKTQTEEVQEESAKTVPEEALSIQGKAETSSEKPPLLMYNSPLFAPFGWPSIIQPLNLAHAQTIPQGTGTSQDPMASAYMPNPSHEQGNPLCSNGPRTPFYILPCPWFFPVPEHGNGLFPHPRDPDSSADNQRNTKATEEVENNQPSLPKHVESDNCNIRQSKSTNLLPEMPKPSSNVESNLLDHISEPKTSSRPANGDIHRLSHSSVIPRPISSLKPCTTNLKCEEWTTQNTVPKEESASSTSGHSGTGFPENKVAQSVYPNKVDAASAAEARKRRKEVTKMKNLNGRQLHLRC